MTTVLGRWRSSTGIPPQAAPGDTRLPAPIRVRRPALAIASVAVVIASVAIFVEVYSGATRETAVVTVVRPVMQGQQITSADLGESSIATSGIVSSVPAGQADQVIGRVATASLAPGTLLTMADVSSGPTISAGDAVVGVALKDGQLPATGVVPGDRVMVIQTETPGTPVGGIGDGSSSVDGSQSGSTSSNPGAGTSTGVLVPDALVHDVATPQASSAGSETELVSLEVSATLAAQVSIAAAADQISLVLLPETGADS